MIKHVQLRPLLPLLHVAVPDLPPLLPDLFLRCLDLALTAATSLPILFDLILTGLTFSSILFIWRFIMLSRRVLTIWVNHQSWDLVGSPFRLGVEPDLWVFLIYGFYGNNIIY